MNDDRNRPKNQRELDQLPLDDLVELYSRIIEKIYTKEDAEGLDPAFRNDILRRIEEIRTAYCPKTQTIVVSCGFSVSVIVMEHPTKSLSTVDRTVLCELWKFRSDDSVV